MGVREIVVYPDEILEKKCEKVTEFNQKLSQLIDDMFETMYEAEGVGLAAPQIGIGKQIAVVDVGDETGKIELVNPVIEKMESEQDGPEGCLSFPGIFGDVKRAQKVSVTAQDRHGRTFTITAEDFLARALQHEIDHLNGILFTSKVSSYYEPGEFER
ncbi:peptide deformylase [Fictibacillus sp. KIGAM418]|uniref:Peptide deformylase n=1 Tax=Fictibacillus marinisediminis TaxID=2878389 RepID=A0A9X1XCN0_9BACL|nr:peptide deformylase [Fictibacillus marinisediminis]MCK6256958.1 peptide deformylase [Fictibacillus marinisediminis]